LSLGSQVLQIGQEVCIWGCDVENKNPPAGDPAPKGIVGYAIAPVASIGCAKVIDATALWNMPGESNGLPDQLPDMAFLALPLSKPVGDGCVRIAVDAQGDPVAVVFPRAALNAPSVSTPPPRPSAASLPGTNANDDGGSLVLAFLGVGALVAAAGVLARRRSREIPS
jgi:LPXTG-motif cell wall-anchored protein